MATGLGGDWLMEKTEYVHRQKRRYMAQVLEEFERDVQPHLPRDAAENFKGTIRAKLHALALDSCDMLTLQEGEVVNGYALDLRRQLEPAAATTR